MKGIEAAATGRLGRDPERRTTKAGNAMVTLAMAVDGDGEETQWLRLLVFGEAAAKAVTLAKGARVYAEGSLKLEQWTSQAGEHRAGLTMLAWRLEPMGQIGRQRPRKPRAPANTTAQRTAIAASAPAELDDPIPF